MKETEETEAQPQLVVRKTSDSVSCFLYKDFCTRQNELLRHELSKRDIALLQGEEMCFSFFIMN